MNKKMNTNQNDQPDKSGSQFNIEELRLSQDFKANLGVKKALVTVPVHKPNKQDFVRVHRWYGLPAAFPHIAAQDQTSIGLSSQKWFLMTNSVHIAVAL